MSATVLVVDDHAFVREALSAFLGREGLTVIGTAATAAEAIDLALALRPDLVITDVVMPGVDVFAAVRRIRKGHPACRIVFLSAFTNDRYIKDALDCGAAGYLVKRESQEALASAVREVLSGGTCFSREIRRRLVLDAAGPPPEDRAEMYLSLLTGRETEVLRYVARGMSTKEIAAMTDVSVNTVENHTASVMRKLAMHDRVELTRFAIREGLVQA